MRVSLEGDWRDGAPAESPPGLGEGGDFLACNICGGDTVESDEDGLWQEDTQGECSECGHPGIVRVVDLGREDGECRAFWSSYDECGPRCTHEDGP